MGIEFRRDRAFYYRKVRRGDWVVSRYVGGGMLGHAAALMDEEGREAERAEAAATWRAERARMEEQERAAIAYSDQVEARVREMLEAAGYHRPKRRWRKRRVQAPKAG